MRITVTLVTMVTLLLCGWGEWGSLAVNDARSITLKKRLERLAMRGHSLQEQHHRFLENENKKSSTNPWQSYYTNSRTNHPKYKSFEHRNSRPPRIPFANLQNVHLHPTTNNLNLGFEIDLSTDFGNIYENNRKIRQNIDHESGDSTSDLENSRQRPRIPPRENIDEVLINSDNLRVGDNPNVRSTLNNELEIDEVSFSAMNVSRNIEEIIKSAEVSNQPFSKDTKSNNFKSRDVPNELDTKSVRKKGGREYFEGDTSRSKTLGASQSQSSRPNRRKGRKRQRSRNRSRSRNRKRKRSRRRNRRNKRHKLEDFIANETLVPHDVDGQPFLDCCPSKLVVVRKHIGKARDQHAVELHPDSQLFYERVCLKEFEGSECLFPARATRPWVDTRCAQTYSFSQALVRPYDSTEDWALDYIEVSSGCSCQVNVSPRNNNQNDRLAIDNDIDGSPQRERTG